MNEPIEQDAPQYPSSHVFVVTYPSGLVETCITHDPDLDAFLATKFGSVDHKDFNVEVSQMSDAEAAAHIEELSKPAEVAQAEEVAEVDHNVVSQDDATHQGGATGEEEPAVVDATDETDTEENTEPDPDAPEPGKRRRKKK